MSSGVNGLGGVYSRALDGLAISQKGLAVAANNIANVNTEGYSRQQMQVGSRATFGSGFLGGGVIASGIISVIDPFVERQLVNEMSDFGTLEGRRNTLLNIETAISDLDGKGLGGALSAFFSSWSDLSQNPASGALRSTVRERGRVVTDMFKNLTRNLNSIRNGLTQTIKGRVTQINALTEQVAKMNESIVNSIDPVIKEELQAQRMLVLRQLSTEVGINYFESADGAMVVQLQGSGFSLVNRFDSAELIVEESTSYGGNVAIKAALPGSGSGIADLTTKISSGRLAGNLIDRNDVLNQKIEELDTLAYELTTRVNAIHQNGYGVDGNTNRNFFATVASEDGAAGLMSLDSDILGSLDAIAAAGQDPAITGVGDSANAQALVALQNTLTMDGGSRTFSQFFTGMGTDVGILAGQINGSLQSRQTLIDKLQIQRDNVSAVNLDEEASDLMRYQKGFEASARVLAIANEMMNTLMDL
jgi:flagellar hook-associated protein 1 FlgK